MLAPFIDTIVTMVTRVGETLEPDEDWMPALFVATGKSLNVIALLEADEDDLVYRIIPKIVQEKKGDCFALVTTAWFPAVRMGDAETYAQAVAKRPRNIEEHPDAVECVMVRAFDRDERLMTMAPITRSDKAPALGLWMTPSTIQGRFADLWKALA